MRFVSYVRRGEWETVVGYGLFVALMSAGYYYNVTFVQLGLIDLGVRVVGMTRAAVSTWMAGLALLTFATAVVAGVTMDRRGGVPTSGRSSGSCSGSSSSSSC